jgi:demethylmenaquinone methyltransferase/2-methoxy-6-polyprenyl-1,4-benzoquinol methylase
MSNHKKQTHFGFQSIAWDEKEKKVREVFHSVADHYDLMNDLMSLGIHRLWKRHAVNVAQVHPGQQILDLAGGSGDLTRLFAKQLGDRGQIVLADINAAMIQVGRDRLLDKGLYKNIHYVQANAQALPFASNHFHCIMISFGLRNVTDKEAALQSMYRVCKPGGKLLVLEFSTPTRPLIKPLYDRYSFTILPKLGQLFAGDADSYQYLVESIRMHPNQETLKTMIEAAGFEDCRYDNFCGGIVALHRAYKY